MASSNVPNMTSASTPDGTELAYIVQASNDRKITLTAILNWILSLANTFTRKQTITPNANEEGLTISGYSLTGSATNAAVNISGTWNTTGTATAVFVNMTDTASNASSRLLSLQVGGADKAYIDKTGHINLGDGAFLTVGTSATTFVRTSGQNVGIGTTSTPFVGVGASGAFLASSVPLGWSSTNTVASGFSTDTTLYRDGAGHIGQRVGANAQKADVYNTYSDSLNWERFTVDWQKTTSTLTIGPEANGTGGLRGVTAQGIWTFSSPVKTSVLTVSTLPSASTSGVGARSFVSDASSPTFGATVTGGGSVATPVYSDGTNWKVG